MGHHIRWDNIDQTVVIQEYDEDGSKEDLHQLVQKSAQLLKTVRHTVHLIIDERKVNLVLTHDDMLHLAEYVPDNEGTVMVVVPPSKIKFRLAFQELYNRIMRKTFINTYYVESIEQARCFLQERFKVHYP
jgi:hypothetical protein